MESERVDQHQRTSSKNDINQHLTMQLGHFRIWHREKAKTFLVTQEAAIFGASAYISGASACNAAATNEWDLKLAESGKQKARLEGMKYGIACSCIG